MVQLKHCIAELTQQLRSSGQGSKGSEPSGTGGRDASCRHAPPLSEVSKDKEVTEDVTGVTVGKADTGYHSRDCLERLVGDDLCVQQAPGQSALSTNQAKYIVKKAQSCGGKTCIDLRDYCRHRSSLEEGAEKKNKESGQDAEELKELKEELKKVGTKK